MKLDLSPLNKAIQSLERAVKRSKQDPDDEEIRDAVILRFKYTYELCWKMLKRKLEAESPTPAAIDQLSFRDLLRDAAEKGFISNPEIWFVYRDQRNITSHTYDEIKAEQVKETAFKFLITAKELADKLQQ
jgi:nucleotidyltransferase substrate binding protein (TIGR01987 family)